MAISIAHRIKTTEGKRIGNSTFSAGGDSKLRFMERPKREDKILPLLIEMEAYSQKKDYEQAGKKLSEAEALLKESSIASPVGDVQTLKDVYELVTSHAIRLNPADYIAKKRAFYGMLLSIYKRKAELQGATYADTERHRKVVAEEMANNGIAIVTHFRGKKPNRRFLEIAFEVNPAISKSELIRREKVKLWCSMESGNETEKQQGKEKIEKLKNSDLQ